MCVCVYMKERRTSRDIVHNFLYEEYKGSGEERKRERKYIKKYLNTFKSARKCFERQKKVIYMKIELYANQEFYSSLFYVHFKA